MFYLTDTVGLSMGIIGTLIALSKVFDGVTDFFFGRMIDKTHTKMGKARPWMLWPYIGCSVALVACFAIPTSWGQTAQYAFFFIAYTLLNAVFFYSKQHCLCFSYSPYNKEYKRKSAAWFNPFHLRIRNKYVDSVHNY